jgi:hypothetical protein
MKMICCSSYLQAGNSPPSMPTTEPPPQTIDQGDKDQCGNVQNNKKRKVTEASTKINDVSNAEQPGKKNLVGLNLGFGIILK